MEKIIDANKPEFLLGILQNIEGLLPKQIRKSRANIWIVRDYMMNVTNKGGKTSSYEMCEYLGIDPDAYTFFKQLP